MKQFKRILALILALSALFCLFGCSSRKMTFTVKELCITLTEDYSLTPTTSYLAAYVNEADDAMVHVVRETKSIIYEEAGKDDVSLMEYANMLINHNKKGSDPREGDGYVYYTFSTATNGIDYTYLCTVHESKNAFWFLQFSVKSAEFNDYYDEFVSYIKSVTFDESYQKA